MVNSVLTIAPNLLIAQQSYFKIHGEIPDLPRLKRQDKRVWKVNASTLRKNTPFQHKQTAFAQEINRAGFWMEYL